MFKSLKVNSKISLVLAISLIFQVIITATGIIATYSMSNNSSKLYTETTLPLAYLNRISDLTGQVRLELKELTDLSNHSKIEELYLKAEELKQSLIDDLNLFEDNISPKLLEDNQKEFEDFFEYGILYAEEAEKALSFIKDNKQGTIFNTLYSNANESYKVFVEKMETMITKISKYAENLAHENIVQRRSLIIIFLIVWIIAITINIILIKITSVSISKPIGEIVDAMNKLSKGEFKKIDVPDYNNEEAELSRSYVEVTKIINDILLELNILAQKSSEGTINYRINSDKFEGAFKEVVESTNSMTDLNNSVTLEILSCLKKFGEGNFDAEIKKFPGEKAVITNTLTGLKNNLTDINSEIDNLVKFALKGDFSKRADISGFSGHWKKIISGLNNFVDAVVNPIEESSFVLKRLSEGDLNVRVTGEYEGLFSEMKDSLNKAVITIAEYVNDIDKTLEQFANNNFDVSLDTEYIGDFIRIKYSLESITNKLSLVIKNIGSAANIVADGAKEVTNNSEHLSLGAVQQSEAVEKMASIIENMSNQIETSSLKANEAEKFSIESKNEAVLGNGQMQSLLLSMDKIVSASNNISTIIKVIDDIAFQTNLLALNASVEAARAGIHGKGFSVVAEEVGNLANKSKEAAEETGALIKESINRVKEGTEKAKSTAVSLNRIVEHANKVSEVINDITVLSKEQLDGISEIEYGIQSIDSVVKTNLAGSQTGTAIAEELLNESESLREKISGFKIKNIT